MIKGRKKMGGTVGETLEGNERERFPMEKPFGRFVHSYFFLFIYFHFLFSFLFS